MDAVRPEERVAEESCRVAASDHVQLVHPEFVGALPVENERAEDDRQAIDPVDGLGPLGPPDARADDPGRIKLRLDVLPEKSGVDEIRGRRRIQDVQGRGRAGQGGFDDGLVEEIKRDVGRDRRPVDMGVEQLGPVGYSPFPLIRMEIMRMRTRRSSSARSGTASRSKRPSIWKRRFPANSRTWLKPFVNKEGRSPDSRP